MRIPPTLRPILVRYLADIHPDLPESAHLYVNSRSATDHQFWPLRTPLGPRPGEHPPAGCRGPGSSLNPPLASQPDHEHAPGGRGATFTDPAPDGTLQYCHHLPLKHLVDEDPAAMDAAYPKTEG